MSYFYCPYCNKKLYDKYGERFICGNHFLTKVFLYVSCDLELEKTEIDFYKNIPPNYVIILNKENYMRVCSTDIFIEDIILPIDCNLTPKNLINKLKTYLTFQ